MKACWWPINSSLRVASTRIRAHYVIHALRASGVDADWYAGAGAPPDVLVLGKRYDPESLRRVAELRAAGTRIVMDLCDNHFYSDRDDARWRRRAETLRAAISECDAVVASTPTLGDVVRTECPSVPVHVIGDALEVFDEASFEWWRPSVLGAHVELMRLWRRLGRASSPSAVKLLWFGHHGSENAEGGMLDLLRIAEPLRQLGDEYAASLTVVSNNREKFERLRSALRIRAHYLPWHESTFRHAVSMHDVCVIPVSSNPFTDCKSPNRLTTALMLGVPVVADPVPSYVEFAPAVPLGNWGDSLASLASNPALRQQVVRDGLAMAKARYDISVIARRWRTTLAEIAAG